MLQVGLETIIFVKIVKIVSKSHQNISYAGITDWPQLFNMVVCDVQIFCFDLASNYRSLRL